MIKKLFLTTQLLFCCFVLHSYARNEYASDSDRDLKRRNKMVKEAALLPDKLIITSRTRNRNRET